MRPCAAMTSSCAVIVSGRGGPDWQGKCSSGLEGRDRSTVYFHRRTKERGGGGRHGVEDTKVWDEIRRPPISSSYLGVCRLQVQLADLRRVSKYRWCPRSKVDIKRVCRESTCSRHFARLWREHLVQRPHAILSKECTKFDLNTHAKYSTSGFLSPSKRI